MDSSKLKKKKNRFFETYISKTIKKIDNRNGITSNAKQQFNSFLCIISKIITDKTIKLVQLVKKKTVSCKEVINVIKILCSKVFSDTVIEKINNTIEVFKVEDQIKGSSRQDKAGIIFPPSICEKFLRNFGYYKIMISNTAPIALAVFLEEISFLILSSASKNTAKNKRVRITVRDLEMSIRENKITNTLFNNNNINFIGGGVKPYIHPSLYQKKSKNKSKMNRKSTGHRFRPGTVSLREIKKLQKSSNCLILAKFPFQKMIRKILNENIGSKLKISKNVFTILQYFIEQETIKMLTKSNFVSIHAGRVKLMAIDIKFTRAFEKKENPYEKLLNKTLKQYEQSKKCIEEESVEKIQFAQAI